MNESTISQLNPRILSTVTRDPERGVFYLGMIRAIVQSGDSPVTVTEWHPHREDFMFSTIGIKSLEDSTMELESRNHEVLEIGAADAAILALNEYMFCRNEKFYN